MKSSSQVLIKLFIIFIFLILAGQSVAQNLGFTYQAVAIDRSKSQGFGRDTQGEVLANKDVTLKFSLLEGSESGTVEYQEIHETTTDIFGIFRLIIGRGLKNTTNALEELDWGNTPYFLQIELDLGNGFELMGIEELLGSPYSLNASKQFLSLTNNELSLSDANMVRLTDNDSTNELISAIELIDGELLITDAGGTKSVNLGISPEGIEIVTDELQSLVLEDTQLSITNDPNSAVVDLSDFLDDTNLSETEVDAYVSNNGFLTKEIDGSVTNEIQDISLSGSDLSISGGSSIDLSFLDTDTQLTEAEVDAFVSDNGYLISEVDGSVNNELQTLSRSGTDVTLTNGGTVSIADDDSDSANEIQDLNLDTSTDILSITGNSTATNIDLSPYQAVFVTTANITSNDNGDYATDDFVFGSPVLSNDGNSTYENRFFFDRSLGAFRAGQGIAFVWDDTFLGEYSIGLGQNVFATGTGSIALGVSTGATGDYAFASGFGSSASGEAASALGFNSIAAGNYSVAMGQASNASAIASVGIGQEVTASGEGAVAMGSSTEASGLHSVSIGSFSDATAENATSIGTSTTASGLRASALGYYSTATGTEGVAIGSYSTAPVFRSMSFGFGNFPYGEGSVAIGYGASAHAAREIALGTYNTAYVPTSDQMSEPFAESDRLLTIGNGENVSNPSDALIILKNANTEINGLLTLDADNDDSGYTLPGSIGTDGQILTSDGAGGTDWENPSLGVFSTTSNVTSNENGDYATDDFVFGSPQLDDDGNADHDVRMFFDKNRSTFRAGHASSTQWDESNLGYSSVAFGSNNIASGNSSFVAGSNNSALGNYSLAFGIAAQAQAHRSIAIGDGATASGYGAIAIGWNAESNGYRSVVLAANSTASGLHSTVLGEQSIASGSWSFAAGNQLTASGLASTAFGQNSTASGFYSFVAGNNSQATGNTSVALGESTVSSGDYTATFGYQTSAPSFGEVVIGLLNTNYSANSTDSFNANDRVFVVGNGTASVPSDALIILKNGNTEINGRLTLDADNDDSGYTLPGSTGTNGQILTSDGTGGTNWLNPASQIQDLNLNGASDILTITGNATPTNIDLSPYENVFETTANVTSNENGDYATDDFVFGSSQLEDDISTFEDNVRVFLDKSTGAFRAGYVNGAQWNATNRGVRSTAFGDQTTASGSRSTALGWNTVASGTGSISSGQNTVASAYNSSAFGNGSLASGWYSSALGHNTIARSYGETVMGSFSTDYIPVSTSTHIPTDRQFVVGNGLVDIGGTTIRSDALIIYKNGNTTLNGELTIDGDNDGVGNSYTLPAQDGPANQIMRTDGAGALYWSTISPTGAFSTITNISSNASGDYATDDFVFGSPSLDDDTNVTHDNRMLFDKSNGSFRAGVAENDEWDEANRGYYSFATGIGNSARSFGETVVGTYASEFPGTAGSYQFGDRLFVVGDGTSDGLRQDALVIYKGGQMEINRLFTQINGQLDVFGMISATDVTATTITGQIFDTSDRRLKKEIEPLEESLRKIAQLNGYNFNWKSVKHTDTTSVQTGFIAQELEELFPELVIQGKDGYKKVNYIGMIPHLLEAIKELKKDNDTLRSQNQIIKTENEQRLNDLEQRLAKFEQLLSNTVLNSEN